MSRAEENGRQGGVRVTPVSTSWRAPLTSFINCDRVADFYTFESDGTVRSDSVQQCETPAQRYCVGRLATGWDAPRPTHNPKVEGSGFGTNPGGTLAEPSAADGVGGVDAGMDGEARVRPIRPATPGPHRGCVHSARRRRLDSDGGIRVDEADLPSTHQASAAAAAQAVLPGSSDHSVNAAE